MKRLLFFALLILSVNANGQTLDTLIARFRRTNNTTITTKSGAGSITPINVGGNIDSTLKYVNAVYDSLLAAPSSPTLANVLNSGDSANHSMTLYSASGLQTKVNITSSSLTYKDRATGKPLVAIGRSGAKIGGLYLIDSSTSFNTIFNSGILSANRVLKSPDANGFVAIAPTSSGLITLDNALTNSPNTNQGINIGKVKSLSPYTSVQIFTNVFDSSGRVDVNDTLGTTTASLSAYNSEGLLTLVSPSGTSTLSSNTGLVAPAISVTTSVLQSGGLKHKRASTGVINRNTNASITITWTTPFLDSNYTVVASIIDNTSTGTGLSILHINTKSATQVVVHVINNDNTHDLTGTINLIAMHD